MSPEQIEIERKAFEADRRALGWDAERLIRFRGESWFGSQETMPTYRSDWTEGQWLGWLARAEKAERVREALAWSEMFWPRDGEDANERFERVAEVFRRETGYLRPGKDCMVHSPEEREAAWDAWVTSKRDAARAALKEDIHG